MHLGRKLIGPSIFFLIFSLLFASQVSASMVVSPLTNQSDLNTGLVGWWTMDAPDITWTSQTTGTARNRGATPLVGTLTGMNRSTNLGLGTIGQAMFFDGSNDEIIMDSDPVGLNTVTVCYWIRPSRAITGSIQYVVSNARTIFGIYNVEGRFIIDSDSTNGTSLLSEENAVVANKWTHFCGVRNSGANGVASMYLDGVLVASGNSGTPVVVGGLNMAIGSDGLGTQEYGGLLDDVRLYNRALTATEIFRIYSYSALNKQNITPNTPSSTLQDRLLAWWSFDGADTIWTSSSAATVRDRSGKLQTGTLTSMSQNSALATGKIGQALQFDGVNDYVSTPLAAGGGSAPTFVQAIETAVWNTTATPKTTASFDVQNGDVLVAYFQCEDGATCGNGSISDNTSTSANWTQQENAGNGSGFTELYMWTKSVTSSESMTVSFARAGTSGSFGGAVMVFRGSTGIGAAESNTGADSATSVNITTTLANSAIVVAWGDWEAAGTTATWRTNAGAFTENHFSHDGATMTTYGGYHADAGSIGTYAVGVTVPAAPDWTLGAIEVKGGASSASVGLGTTTSISFWAKPATLTQSLIDLNGYANIDISAGTVRANNISSPTIYVDGIQTTAFPDTDWHHVAITWSSATTTPNFAMGKISSSFYKGQMDDVRVYAKTLTAGNVQQLYQLGAGVKQNVTPQLSPDGLGRGLVGHWTFDGKDAPSGRFLDRTGNGNTGYAIGISSTTFYTIGKIGQAVKLDNSDDYINVSDSSSLVFTDGAGNDTPYSISAWVYMNDISETAGIVSKWEDCANKEWVLYITSSKLYVENYSGANCSHFIGRTADLTTSDHQGRWIHVAATYSGSELSSGLKLYINGVQADNAASILGTYDGFSNTAVPLQIGAYAAGSNLLNGSVDDVRVFKRELSANEVRQLYNGGK